MGIKRGTMKFPFFKSMLVAGALMLAWNCTDNTTVNPTNLIPNMAENVQVLDQDGQKYYITEDGKVFDEQWNAIGQYADGKITNESGETVVDNIEDGDLSDVQVVTTDNGDKLVVDGDGKVTDTEGNDVGKVDDNGDIVSNNGDVIAENPNKPASNANQQTTTSSASNGNNNQNNNTTSSASNGSNNQNNNTTSSASNQTQNSTASGDNCGDNKCYDSVSSQCVDHYAHGLRGAHEEQYSYDASCVFQCWYDPTGNNCADVGTVSNPNPNPNPTPSSNSQQTPSSNSQQQTPSSTSQQTGSCPNIVAKGGDSGSGFASRYWDCCKPSCSWAENTQNLASQCSNKGTTKSSDWGAASVCDGGPMATCISQIPFTIDGCSNIGFAFAAVPTNAACGRCFELTFTGEGKYETTLNHKKLKGKKLIVMASNIGYDVNHQQFDIMIPGGGFGAFDGCSSLMGWSGNMGERYGGLLSVCENEVGYSGSEEEIYTKRKECLVNKCNTSFGSDSQAKQGCLFLANFMEAAGNPNHTYREVECPSVLTAKY